MLREEQMLWSTICDDLDTILDRASTYDLADEVRVLLARTRREQVSAWEWKEVLDDLAERVSWATDYAGLGDRRMAATKPAVRGPVARQVGTEFGCPGGLCDRRATSGVLDPVPVCRVLARDMTLLA